MLYQCEYIVLTALVSHADLFQQAQCLTVDQLHLFRVEWFIDAAHQSATVHFTSFTHPITIHSQGSRRKAKLILLECRPESGCHHARVHRKNPKSGTLLIKLTFAEII